MGHKPSVWSGPSGGEHVPQIRIEVTEDKFELVHGGSDQDYAFAHRPPLEVKNGLHGMLIARVCSQAPDALCGIGDHPTGCYMAGSVPDRWMKAVVQGILWGLANGGVTSTKGGKSTSVGLEGQA